jgi:hypothetical protein
MIFGNQILLGTSDHEGLSDGVWWSYITPKPSFPFNMARAGTFVVRKAVGAS